MLIKNMRKVAFLILSLIAMSCSAYYHGLINNKKPYAQSKAYYGKNLKGNKPLFKKYKGGNSKIYSKERNEWQYSRETSVTHRKAMNRIGGYND